MGVTDFDLISLQALRKIYLNHVFTLQSFVKHSNDVIKIGAIGALKIEYNIELRNEEFLCLKGWLIITFEVMPLKPDPHCLCYSTQFHKTRAGRISIETTKVQIFVNGM